MKRALIVGGGIAGPMTAMALARAGIEATVFEAYPEGAALGAGAWLTLAVNGLDAMRALGVHARVMACGFPSTTIELASGTGKLLGAVPLGGTLEDGTVTHTLKRADLYREVADEARRRGVRIEHEKRFADAEIAASGAVVARFEDGTEARGDVLIGADGLHSRVRRVIDPSAPRPRYTGLLNAGGFASRAGVEVPPGTYRMIFGKRCFFGLTVSPSGELFWFANPPCKEEPSREELARTSSDEWKARLVELASADVSPLAAIIAATERPIVTTAQHDMPRVPTWRRGPMIVIGDAAHAASPSSGQGASLACEDAIELARCLRDVDDVPEALARYEQLRRARVEAVVAYGAKMGSAKTVGPVGRVLRDLALPWFLARQRASMTDASLAWLFHHHIDWDARVASRARMAPSAEARSAP